VATLLRRLEAKGLVARRPSPVGKAFLYRASDRSAAAIRGALRRLVRGVFGGDRLSVVSTLYTEPASEKELEDLRRLVEVLGERPRAEDA
jgi:predicted transcriptional regulator